MRKIGGAGSLGWGALLYDYIPLSTSRNLGYNLPICVFFLRKVNILNNDHVYIFFNKNVTAEEITLIVKHYLGIGDRENFLTTPPITVSNASVHEVEEEIYDNLWEFLGDTFVKLSGCETFNNNYCLETGVFDPKRALFDVVTIKHEMTSMSKAVEIKTRNRSNIQEFLLHGFSQRIPEMRTTVQPDLFKIYIERLKSQLDWDPHVINRQKEQKERNKQFGKNGGFVFGEDRELKLTYSKMMYLDQYTPKKIVMNIQYQLQELSHVVIPDDISDETKTDAKAAVEAQAAVEDRDRSSGDT